MKFAFVTCVQLGLSCMKAIYDAGYELDLAITLGDEQAKSKSGRVFLDDFCELKNIPLHKCINVNDDDVVAKIKESGIDWLFIIGWSQIAKKDILEAPRRGAIGIHPTLLPKGRGRAAIPWAIIKGLEETGVTLFRLDDGVDTGEIIAQEVIPLSPDTTATELYSMVEEAQVAVLTNNLSGLAAGKVELQTQDETQATYWEGRKPEDGLLDFNGPVSDAERLIRAVTKPYPGAFYHQNGQKIVVWKARLFSGNIATGPVLSFCDGKLELLEYEVVSTELQ